VRRAVTVRRAHSQAVIGHPQTPQGAYAVGVSLLCAKSVN
jgi:hypothetical protein